MARWHELLATRCDLAPTMSEVARRAGVGRAAVSFVFNDCDTTHVSEETRARILRAMEELGYEPHGPARSLVQRRTRTIGVGVYRIDYLTDYYFAAIVAGMEEVMGREDYNLHVVTTAREGSVKDENLFFVRKAREKRLDGLVIIDQNVSERDLRLLAELEVPFVMIDKDIENSGFYSVCADHAGGARQAVDHLALRGHRRIGLLRSPRHYWMGACQFDGYMEGLKGRGLGFDEKLVRELEADRPVSAQLAGLLEVAGPPTAVLVSDDSKAVEALNAALDRGLNVPADLAIVGFNDMPVARMVRPQITSVQLPLRRMGEEAVRTLIALLAGRETTPRKLALDTELVVRESSGHLQYGVNQAGKEMKSRP